MCRKRTSIWGPNTTVKKRLTAASCRFSNRRVDEMTTPSTIACNSGLWNWKSVTVERTTHAPSSISEGTEPSTNPVRTRAAGTNRGKADTAATAQNPGVLMATGPHPPCVHAGW